MPAIIAAGWNSCRYRAGLRGSLPSGSIRKVFDVTRVLLFTPTCIGIGYPDRALKKELWEIVRSNKPSQVKYVIDQIAAARGN